MNPLNFLRRPEYAWHPSQIARRLRRRSILRNDQVRLAWGSPITIDPHSHIGRDILNLGVYDRVVAESLFRLAKNGDWAIDAGANIGQNTSILALAVGASGRVTAFEPNPGVLRFLERNVLRWKLYDQGPIDIEPRALSDRDGTCSMHPSLDSGGFSLEAMPPAIHLGHEIAGQGGREFPVEAVKLDSYVSPNQTIGILKLDVEGHEASILLGAQRLLRDGRIRDIVFEDYEPQPSRTVRLLRDNGFEISAVISRWRGIELVPLNDWSRFQDRHPPNFAATRIPGRLETVLAPRGWRCLRKRAVARAPTGP